MNVLLAVMPIDELRTWRPDLEPVAVLPGQVICEADAEIEYVYFPVTSIVSLLSVMRNGQSAEVAVVGAEGMLGVTVFMGSTSTTLRAVVLSAGEAYRLPARVLAATVARGGETLRIFLQYTQALLTQMTQTTACYRLHTSRQQFCRWLLMSLDRLQGGDLLITPKLMSQMLGVEGGAAAAVATSLAEIGAIDYADGRITLRDRAMLEGSACECYAKVRDECRRLTLLGQGESQRYAATMP